MHNEEEKEYEKRNIYNVVRVNNGANTRVEQFDPARCGLKNVELVKLPMNFFHCFCQGFMVSWV